MPDSDPVKEILLRAFCPGILPEELLISGEEIGPQSVRAVDAEARVDIVRHSRGVVLEPEILLPAGAVSPLRDSQNDVGRSVPECGGDIAAGESVKVKVYDYLRPFLPELFQSLYPLREGGQRRRTVKKSGEGVPHVFMLRKLREFRLPERYAVMPHGRAEPGDICPGLHVDSELERRVKFAERINRDYCGVYVFRIYDAESDNFHISPSR